MTHEKLERAHKWAQIFALLAIPLLVAIVGWIAQKSIADMGLRKDWVNMAIQVLHEPRRADDSDIRGWAKKIVQHYSPVPFSADAADQLSSSVLGLLNSSPLLTPAQQHRPACISIDLMSLPTEHRRMVEELQAQCERNYQDIFWLQIWLGLANKSVE